MDLSIVIPAYNEAGRIAGTLATLVDYFRGGGLAWEIIVVDDGSSDDTPALVTALADKYAGGGGELRLLRETHRGKGAAVASGVAAARGKWILMTDADLSTPISEWPKIEAALLGGARVAAGSRQIAGSRIEVRQPWLRQNLGMLFGRVVRWLFPVGVIDSQCGFKGFEAQAGKQLFQGLRSTGFCFDVEVLLEAAARGFTVAEVPVRWANHPDSKVRPLHDWPRVLLELMAIRRARRNGGRNPTGGGGS